MDVRRRYSVRKLNEQRRSIPFRIHYNAHIRCIAIDDFVPIRWHLHGSRCRCPAKFRKFGAEFFQFRIRKSSGKRYHGIHTKWHRAWNSRTLRQVNGAYITNHRIEPIKNGHFLFRDFVYNFNGSHRDSNGPGVLTRVLRDLCQTKNAFGMKPERCSGFKVYLSIYQVNFTRCPLSTGNFSSMNVARVKHLHWLKTR